VTCDTTSVEITGTFDLARAVSSRRSSLYAKRLFWAFTVQLPTDCPRHKLHFWALPPCYANFPFLAPLRYELSTHSHIPTSKRRWYG
jgi:hypothetical protein